MAVRRGIDRRRFNIGGCGTDNISLEVLKKLGLEDIELKLSHAGLIRALLTGFWLVSGRAGENLRSDSGWRCGGFNPPEGRNTGTGAFADAGADMKGETPVSCAILKQCSAAACRNFIPALDNFIGVVDMLTAMGIKYQIDIASGRGFEYYTGMIFQIYSGDAKIGRRRPL